MRGVQCRIVNSTETSVPCAGGKQEKQAAEACLVHAGGLAELPHVIAVQIAVLAGSCTQTQHLSWYSQAGLELCTPASAPHGDTRLAT